MVSLDVHRLKRLRTMLPSSQSARALSLSLSVSVSVSKKIQSRFLLDFLLPTRSVKSEWLTQFTLHSAQ
jgi:hypothetical protein